MIEPINACGIDVACVGNHEFDYSLDYVESRFKKCNFPWLSSNLFNIKTGNILANNNAYYIEEKMDIKVGIIGLAEEEWLDTLTEIDMTVVRYEDYVICANKLIKILREDYECEFIIALTHMRVPNDTLLAEKVPDIDLILGGHDHIIISKIVN